MKAFPISIKTLFYVVTLFNLAFPICVAEVPVKHSQPLYNAFSCFSTQIEVLNSPFNISSAVRRIIGQFVPRPNREINVVLIAGWASVLNGGDDNVSLSSDSTIVAIKVGDFDLTSTERTRRFFLHPVVADGRNLGSIGASLSTRTRPSLLCVDGRFTVVAIRILAPMIRNTSSVRTYSVRLARELASAFSAGAAVANGTMAKKLKQIWKCILRLQFGRLRRCNLGLRFRYDQNAKK